MLIICDGSFYLLQDRASEIYKKVEDQKSSRGRNQDAILAACLYIACRQEDKPRTVKGTALDFYKYGSSSIFVCVWASLNMWISYRNLFCRQWSDKKRDWSGKRVHCETAGGRNGASSGHGNYTCWRLLGKYLFP